MNIKRKIEFNYVNNTPHHVDYYLNINSQQQQRFVGNNVHETRYFTKKSS